MNAYENMIGQMKQYPKNHYKFLALQGKINKHISGLRMTAMKFPNTGISKVCNKDANYYERLLRLVINSK